MFFIFRNCSLIPFFIYHRTVELSKCQAKLPQKTTLLYHANQLPQRKTQSSLSSSRKSSVEEEFHLKNNSLTTTERYWDSSPRAMIFNLSGNTSWLMIPSKLVRFTSQMMDVIHSQSIWEDRNSQKPSVSINQVNNSLETDTWLVMKFTQTKIS